MKNPPAFVEIDPSEPVAFWQERFGADPAAFEGHRFFERRRKLIWITTPGFEVPEHLSLQAIGMGFVRRTGHHLKPTTEATIAFGHLATRNIVDVNAEDLQWLIDRQSRPWPQGDLEPGYVILRHDGFCIGCGLWLKGQLISQLPKKWHIEPQKPLSNVHT